MAQRIVVELTSDISGSAADETVTFAVDDVSYEIDLTTEEADQLRSAMQPYTSSARKVGRSTSPAARRRRRAAPSGYDAVAVRAWAAANGIEVSKRGRISQDVLGRFRAASN
ncbi:histone-like nucleoid-structuring protein Lsr2 [Sanguibacter suarezii]|uniref:histone-like nucleoid-structuring protein Lsr2 n=1 Tax=Sanguibacter suarezii TaxID=60921 RepID=UPI00082C7EA7|nr:Lsr2 family protein [Sanguibacter suarezii]